MVSLLLLKKIVDYSELVKFEHTIFALPFALSAMLLACPKLVWPTPLTILWIVMAMMGGRTYAMALNRLLDATIDAKNPRTQNRAIPSGRVKPWEAWTMVIVSFAVLLWATMQLPVLCFQLLPIAVALLTVYSFMKRISSLAHLVLGLALGASAIGGWVAVTGQLTGLSILFGLAITAWVAGFDVMYACQDQAFDQAEGLHSIPAWLGISTSLWISRGLHTLSVVFLLSFWAWYNAVNGGHNALLCLAIGLMACLLFKEHRLVSPTDLSRLDEAFFAINGQISLIILAGVVLTKWL
jgi:4-hydroxybenzoate polyprenyltransferase